jgi:hypothetical protein
MEKPILWLLQLLLKLVNVPNASVMIIESAERWAVAITPVRGHYWVVVLTGVIVS